MGVGRLSMRLSVLGAFFALVNPTIDHNRSGLAAQTPPSLPGRLTVRPSEMATGTRTASAGEQAVDSIADYLVYVPQSCVGTQRCPLVVVLHGGGGDASEQLDRQQEFADQHGMILLLGTSVVPGRWDVMGYYAERKVTMDPGTRLVRAMPDDEDVRNIDAAMKYVLKKYAIDPNKIALLGMSDGGSYTLFLGRNNLDIFSRLAAMSPGVPFNGAGPQNPSTQVFLLGGIAEDGFFRSSLKAANELESTQQTVKRALLLRGHAQRQQDYALMFAWLKESWAPTATQTPPPPRAISADSVVALNEKVMTQMTEFWTSLMAQSSEIIEAGQTTHRTHVLVPVGARQLLLPMFDVPALAAQYPEVAADLEAAGLTARQAEDYGIALASARATKVGGTEAGSVAPESALAKNVEFLDTHADALEAFQETRFFNGQ